MALIKCPECENEIDATFKMCPNCGTKLIQNNTLNNIDSSSFSHNSNSVFVINHNDGVTSKHSKKLMKNPIFTGIIGFFIGCICTGVSLTIFSNHSQFSYNKNVQDANNEIISESVDKDVDNVIDKNNTTSTELEKASLSEKLLIRTEEGSFYITIIDITEPGWAKTSTGNYYDSDSQKVISLNCVVESIDFMNDIYGGLYINRFITVFDEDDFIQEHLDIQGPSNGEYQLNYTIPTGGKAKVGYTYTLPKDCQSISININDQYLVDEISIT